MALIMQEMGNNNRQVISITHLPQIAALGTSHYKVEKEETAEGTRSHMRELTQEQRVNEIAQMLRVPMFLMQLYRMLVNY